MEDGCKETKDESAETASNNRQEDYFDGVLIVEPFEVLHAVLLRNSTSMRSLVPQQHGKDPLVRPHQ